MRTDAERLRFIKPQEPILVEVPPVSDDSLHERLLHSAHPRLGRRSGLHPHRHRLSKRYWLIVAAAEKLKAKSFILDGDMIAPDPNGRPNFHAMHSRMAWNAELLAFVAFDILHKDGEDLRQRPLIERKAILWDLIRPAQGIIQYSQHVEGGGAEFFEVAEKMGLEGMVSKRCESSYRSGAKDESWLKIKCWDISEFDLIGVKRQAGERTEGLFARDGKYVGKAVIAATDAIKDRLWKRVEKAKAGPPVGVPTAEVTPDIEWVKPGITARVKTLRGEHKLRHASVQDFREEN